MAPGFEPTGTDSSPVSEAAILLDHATDLKDQAYESGDASFLLRAIEQFDELERRYSGSVITLRLAEILAMGSYNRSGALWSLGRTAEARDGFAALAERYGQHDDPRLRKVGQFAELRRALLISVPEPPQYILPPAAATSGSSEGPKDSGDSQDREHASAILASHRRAMDILFRFRGTASPFVLFLRSFEAEAYELLTAGDWTVETGLEPHTVSMSSVQPSDVERQLVDFFPHTPAVLAVANRLSSFESAWSAPRLFLPDEGWKDIIGVLIRAAFVTVMQIGMMSPGVRWELEQIDACGAVDRTLLVCGWENEDSLRMMEALRLFAGLPASNRQLLRTDDPSLRSFPHVIAWEEIPPEGVSAVQPLPDLLAGVQSFQALDPEERLSLILETASEAHDPSGLVQSRQKGG